MTQHEIVTKITLAEAYVICNETLSIAQIAHNIGITTDEVRVVMDVYPFLSKADIPAVLVPSGMSRRHQNEENATVRSEAHRLALEAEAQRRQANSDRLSDAVKMYVNGSHMNDACKTFGVASATLSKYLKENGLFRTTLPSDERIMAVLSNEWVSPNYIEDNARMGSDNVNKTLASMYAQGKVERTENQPHRWRRKENV